MANDIIDFHFVPEKLFSNCKLYKPFIGMNWENPSTFHWFIKFQGSQGILFWSCCDILKNVSRILGFLFISIKMLGYSSFFRFCGHTAIQPLFYT